MSIFTNSINPSNNPQIPSEDTLMTVTHGFSKKYSEVCESTSVGC